jgi:alanyl-tRNA synthetase
MKSSEIRKKFLKFFESKGHKALPSSSLVPTDPTVLLTLAGMLQFKPIFLGMEKPKYKRVTTVQKCIRMNDIENVGKTSRHHTFFEMLGNFSFGDYFKKEAIAFAWELLTKEFSLPADKMLIAVFEKDDESFNIWNRDIGIPKERIYRLGEENNFWSAGATGPCGPCSEIYYDLGQSRGCGRPECAPGCDCDRFLEIWNLVFIQYNRDDKGRLIDLPARNIDTGMGLERIASILQCVPTNFGTDLFKPIMDSLDWFIKVSDEKLLDSKKIIADHIRAIVHLIADQVVPSNEGRGYVLRRLIRRAVRHGKLLGINEPFLFKLSNVVSEVNGQFYPEVKKDLKYISQAIKIEEDHFRKTLEQGIDLLKKMIAGGQKLIPGKDVFLLHDTYGFPVELTREIAGESGVAIDEEGFAVLMGAQKEHSRTSGIGIKSKHFMEKFVDLPPTNFVGYTSNSTDSKIAHIDEDDGLVVLEKTVFYPESGGQVGDVGKFVQEKKEFEVIETFGQISGVIAHKVKDLKGIKPKAPVKLLIDVAKRKAASANHTATHLLHSVLREIFGKGVRQSGSFVSPYGFRFDFSHFGSISKGDMEKIEKRVNELIKEKHKVDIMEVSQEEARKRGALMFFGEKYGERVRMIKIGNVSLELCGGTHVRNTSEIGFFKIINESSISSGVRRVEAAAGEAARQYILKLGSAEWEKNKEMFGRYETLELKKEFLEGKPETYYQFFRITSDEIETLKKAVSQGNILLVDKILEDFKKKNSGLSGRIDQLKGEMEAENLEAISKNLGSYIKDAIEIKGTKIFMCEFRHYESETLRKISDIIKGQMRSYVSAIISTYADKVMMILSVSDDLVSRGIDAGALAKIAASVLGGGGGGKKTIAEAGGRDASRVKPAFDRIVEEVRTRLAGGQAKL